MDNGPFTDDLPVTSVMLNKCCLPEGTAPGNLIKFLNIIYYYILIYWSRQCESWREFPGSYSKNISLGGKYF